MVLVSYKVSSWNNTSSVLKYAAQVLEQQMKLVIEIRMHKNYILICTYLLVFTNLKPCS
jgi:hypothetical protein